MEIKIQLPNPDDYQYATGVNDWFSQMRISLKAAEKTYQEATKNLTDEERENYYIDIGLPEEMEEPLYALEKDHDPSIRDFIHKNICLKVWSV